MGVHILSMLSWWTTNVINVSGGVQPLSMLIAVYYLYQCYQGYATFINLIRGVNNIYRCLLVCTNTFTNIIRDDQSIFVNPNKMINHFCQYYSKWPVVFIKSIWGGHCLPHIPLTKGISHPNGIEIINKRDITHPCTYLFGCMLLHTW